MSFAWGALMVHRHVWPYPILAPNFGDRPSAAGVSKEYRRVRTVHGAIQGRFDTVFLGDSITAQTPWHELFPSLTVANRGIGGERFEDMASRLSDVISLQPQRVFIMGGVNSAGRETPTKAVDDLEKIVERLENANIEVVLQTAMRPRGDRRAFVNKFNQVLRRRALERGWKLIDLSAMADEDGLKADYSLDGTHLTGPGMLAWRDILQPYISNSSQ